MRLRFCSRYEYMRFVCRGDLIMDHFILLATLSRCGHVWWMFVAAGHMLCVLTAFVAPELYHIFGGMLCFVMYSSSATYIRSFTAVRVQRLGPPAGCTLLLFQSPPAQWEQRRKHDPCD